jgi:hypothetical protein
VTDPSSTDLHPTHGGRFVLTRRGDHPLCYRVQVYLPAGRMLESQMRFDASGTPALDPALPDAWATEETLKLARILKRTPKERLTRWRG